MEERNARSKHWVLIETGANQKYIFASNRLRHIVGASHLVHEVGTAWVPEAVASCELPADTAVMTASGKALLLVDSGQQGRDVIRAVSRRALRDAPGLEVTGVVGPRFDPTGPGEHERARIETYRRHAAVRAARRSPLVRDRVFPWHRLCRDSGRPAMGVETFGDEPGVPAAAAVLARSAVRHEAQARLRGRLGDRLASIFPTGLEDIRHHGWIAVVHADGNGVGGLFREFLRHVATAKRSTPEQVTLQTHARYQRDVALELDEATWAAVRDAVRALPGSPAELAGRLLPIVVGGDDVTVACDAALAMPFVRVFADAFARHTAAQPTLAGIALAATGHAGLTASAGIAVVKPHHPFATAYELAESLTVSAKQFTDGTRTLAAFDVHIAHGSTLRGLQLLRECVHDGDRVVARHAGPYLLGDPARLPEHLRHRSVALLDEASDGLGPDGWLSGAQAHALREAAARSLPEYERQVDLTVDRAGNPLTQRARQLLAVQDLAPQPFLRLFDALYLRGLQADRRERDSAGQEPTTDGGDR